MKSPAAQFRRSSAMGELGSIFAEEPGDEAKPRGEDLYFVVDVPRNYLGDPDGFVADIPEEIDKDGQMVRRVIVPGDDGVPLRLPEDFPTGRTLRLRRQGGVCDGGVPGDLFVRVELVESEPGALAKPPSTTEVSTTQEPPSLTPWLMGAGLFAIAALGIAYALFF